MEYHYILATLSHVKNAMEQERNIMNRAQMLFSVESILEAVKDSKKEGKVKGNTPVLFLPGIEDISDEQKGEDEYEALGFFVSHNPLDSYKRRLENLTSTEQLELYPEKTTIKMGGLITNLKQITTKAGKPMAFFDLEDLSGRVEVVAFTSIYNKNKSLFTKNNTVEIVGKLEIQVREFNGEEIVTPKIILMKISPLKEGKKINKITIFPKENDDFKKIRDIIVSNSGDTPIEVEYQNALLKTDYKITSDSVVLAKLEDNCLMRREYAN